MEAIKFIHGGSSCSLISSFHSTILIIPEALCYSSHQGHPILRSSCSIPSFLSRSATEIPSLLFFFYLVLTGVVSESILFLQLSILVIFAVHLFYRVPSSLFFFSLAFLFHLIPLPFCLGPKISGRDLLLVEESCNAPRPMLELPSIYF